MMTRKKEPGSQALDLAGIDLFAGLRAAMLAELARTATVRRFAPGQALWRAGGAANAMLVVLDGEVRVTRNENGRQRVMHTEKRGGTLGDVAFFSGEPYPATPVAVTTVTTLVLTRDTLLALIAADTEFAFRLTARLARRVTHVIGLIDRITVWSVQARLAHFLLHRRAVTGRDDFTLGMTHQQLAEELGTVREVVVRSLGELKEAGHIEAAGRGRYYVREANALVLLAQPATR